MAIVNAAQKSRSISDPLPQYESMRPLWEKIRAVLGGERFVKDYDSRIDTTAFSNLLIPFSPSMSQQQYDFYKAEAELPGIVSQYARTLIGGLLRKPPQVKLPDGLPEEALNWILNQFSHTNGTLSSFLNEIIREEIFTARAWVYVDYPALENPDTLSKDEILAIKPYPVIWVAESIINWQVSTDPITGAQKLMRVLVRAWEKVYTDENEFHPELRDTIYVHELVGGKYQIRKFQKSVEDAQVPVANGEVRASYKQGAAGTGANEATYELIDTKTDILLAGDPLDFIPAWPINGSIEVQEPILLTLVDKELALYNKVSRRNHLLYGAATYTPVISSDMSDDDFEVVVGRGLGSWIKLRSGESASVLDTPTAALQDMDRSIGAALEEMARIGVRMLSPETAQSGVALEIRNAGQTAQLGLLNTKISNQFSAIIAFMLRWRYQLDVRAEHVHFELSADFNPTPLGADWLRLATEWYEKGFIPRTVWLNILKTNDMLTAEYNDEEGQLEINNDPLIYTTSEQQAAYDRQVAAAMGVGQPTTKQGE